ncbi:MAG: histidine phosphatase family protein [Myxococcota bacterium]
MSRLAFVRHGQSLANARRVHAGQSDDDLSPLGIIQARRLAATLEGWTIDRLVSSDLKRAVHTAQLAWPHATPRLETYAALRERDIGEWEGIARDSPIKGRHPNRLLTWDEGPPGGESLHQLATRVMKWFIEHDDGSRMLIVVHGGVIRCILGLLDDLPYEHIGALKIANVQVERRDVSPERWSQLATRLRV